MFILFCACLCRGCGAENRTTAACLPASSDFLHFHRIPSDESGVAQWLARWAHNPKVCGSKPCSAKFWASAAKTSISRDTSSQSAANFGGPCRSRADHPALRIRKPCGSGWRAGGSLGRTRDTESQMEVSGNITGSKRDTSFLSLSRLLFSPSFSIFSLALPASLSLSSPPQQSRIVLKRFRRSRRNLHTKTRSFRSSGITRFADKKAT